MHGERHESDADATAAVCEQRMRETCVRARYRTLYGRHDIVRSTNPRSISCNRYDHQLNRGRHIYSAGRPSRWALAHISSFISVFMCIQTPPESNSVGKSSGKRSTRIASDNKLSKRRRIIDSDSDNGINYALWLYVLQTPSFPLFRCRCYT